MNSMDTTKPKSYTIAAFYQFTQVPNYESLRTPLVEFCKVRDIRGTMILAPEGINGTISGHDKEVKEVLDFLIHDPIWKGCFTPFPVKFSFSTHHEFYRLKVKIKPEIVTLAQPDANPLIRVGTYVPPNQWNQIISDPEVLVIDTRNDYEYEVGTFQGALKANTNHFREFPQQAKQLLDPKVHKKVAMFCTGGIRCEKATSWLLNQGFDQVYHLQGGILKYLEEVPEEQSLWKGECFVFDNRVAVTHGLEQGIHTLCPGCRMPLHPDDLNHGDYEEGVSCHRCKSSKSEEDLEHLRERQRQIKLAKERGIEHIGFVYPITDEN